MRLRILTLPNEGEFIALVKQDDEDLKSTRVGGGPTERAAVQDAINAYFAEQSEPLLDERPAAPVAVAPGQWATDQRAIRSIIEHAIEEGGVVRIVYVDAQDTKSERDIRPTELEDGRTIQRPFPQDRVVAYDLLRDDARTFRLDRIEAARFVL